MPKKPQQQTESGGKGLSREDRKTEQICKMIERAEKQRLKREQKKKLAVLNKGTTVAKTVSSGVGNPGNGVQRKQKKIGLLSTKRTQVAIRILFNESVRTQNASNRYFFERKQTIEEKQRMEQEEMWTRYALRVQQSQQQQAAAAMVSAQQQQTISQHLPPLHDNLNPNSMITRLERQYDAMRFGQNQPSLLNYPQSYGAAAASGMQHQSQNIAASPVQTAYRCNLLQQQQNSLVHSQQLQLAAQQNAYPPQISASEAEQQFYMNNGATGGNYDAGIEDQSGSSYFSSASKRAMQQSIQQQQQDTIVAAQMQQYGVGGRALTGPLPRGPASETVLQQQPTSNLDSVLSALQQQKSNALGEIEEVKEHAPGTIVAIPDSCSQQQQIKIDVNLNAGKKLNQVAEKMLPRNQIITELNTGISVRQQEVNGIASQPAELTEEQKILELTRQQMQRRSSPPAIK